VVATQQARDAVLCEVPLIVHDEIAARPGGYESSVADNGRNYSGGQCQRIEIARAMARRPRLIVLDEATSALDPIVEQDVMTSLMATGAGLLIIAHRLSTVRDCDEIIVLDRGSVLERGTHDSLMALDGAYARLVSS
jgi:ABC-type multidrug transport system fused ATPase/permease subunit